MSRLSATRSERRVRQHKSILHRTPRSPPITNMPRGCSTSSGVPMACPRPRARHDGRLAVGVVAGKHGPECLKVCTVDAKLRQVHTRVAVEHLPPKLQQGAAIGHCVRHVASTGCGLSPFRSNPSNTESMMLSKAHFSMDAASARCNCGCKGGMFVEVVRLSEANLHGVKALDQGRLGADLLEDGHRRFLVVLTHLLGVIGRPHVVRAQLDNTRPGEGGPSLSLIQRLGDWRGSCYCGAYVWRPDCALHRWQRCSATGCRPSSSACLGQDPPPQQRTRSSRTIRLASM